MVRRDRQGIAFRIVPPDEKPAESFGAAFRRMGFATLRSEIKRVALLWVHRIVYGHTIPEDEEQ